MDWWADCSSSWSCSATLARQGWAGAEVGRTAALHSQNWVRGRIAAQLDCLKVLISIWWHSLITKCMNKKIYCFSNLFFSFVFWFKTWTPSSGFFDFSGGFRFWSEILSAFHRDCCHVQILMWWYKKLNLWRELELNKELESTNGKNTRRKWRIWKLQEKSFPGSQWHLLRNCNKTSIGRSGGESLNWLQQLHYASQGSELNIDVIKTGYK